MKPDCNVLTKIISNGTGLVRVKLQCLFLDPVANHQGLTHLSRPVFGLTHLVIKLQFTRWVQGSY